VIHYISQIMNEVTNIKKLPDISKLTTRQSKLTGFILAAILLIIIVIALVTEITRPEPYEVTTYAMGSYIQQTLYGKEDEEGAAKAASAAAVLEDLISWKIEGSDIFEINKNAGDIWTQVSLTTENILEEALAICKDSSGALDITVAPLSQLWAFDESPTEPPPAELIEELLPYVDYAALRHDPESQAYSFKSEGYALDLGAVGKGAACDVMIAEYRAHDIDAAIVAVGGSVATYGEKPGGKKWQIAVRDPYGSGAMGVMEIGAGYLSTSGSYEKTFEFEGRKYHHILDPKTGYPKETDLLGVTILSFESGLHADALSTACFNLGYEESLPLLEKYDAMAVFIYEDRTVRLTEGTEEYFRLVDKNGDYKIVR